MPFRATQLSTLGVPGRTTPRNPSLFNDAVLFVDRIALEIDIEPARGDDEVITQFLQVGDVGVPIVVQMVNQSTNDPLDISLANVLTILFQYPSGEGDSFTAQLLTDGTDGKIVYVTQSGELDEIGIYGIQGHIEIGTSLIKSGWVRQFEVRPNVILSTP